MIKIKKTETTYLDWLPVQATWTPAGPTETLTAKSFPMTYLQKPVKTQELRSKVENATVIHVTKEFPEIVTKKGKAKELRSKFE